MKFQYMFSSGEMPPMLGPSIADTLVLEKWGGFLNENRNTISDSSLVAYHYTLPNKRTSAE